MSNDALLLNVTFETDTIVEEKQSRGPYVIVAEAAYIIPIPWFFCFTESDLKTVSYTHITGSGEEIITDMSMPTTTVEQAKSHLYDSRELMEKICGDKTIGHGYWKDAVERFVEFPNEFISLDFLDLFHMNHWSEWDEEGFRKCFSRNESAFYNITGYAAFEEGVIPYEIERFLSDPELADKVKVQNSSAMQCSVYDPQYRSASSANVDSPPVLEKKQFNWKFWK